jgi:hypothetical protein
MATNAVIDMSDLKDLEPLSVRLNAASDELTKALEAIQHKLNALALGVEVFLGSPSQELRRDVVGVANDIRTLRIHELGYGRIGDGWGLIVRSCIYTQSFDSSSNEWDFTSPEPENIEGYKPLLKASRDMRVKAVALIPDLIKALRKSADAVIKAVEQAKAIADSLS